MRRELSMNFVNFNERYDSYDCLPEWAQDTLRAHREDRREHRYCARQLERAETHHRYWNAAMSEMVHTGYMHNYTRMHWAKKILEWTPEPVDAFRTTFYLSNKYFLDGRDASSCANVAWAFGLHDRPWPERPVFGQVRYRNASGSSASSTWRPICAPSMIRLRRNADDLSPCRKVPAAPVLNGHGGSAI